MAKTDKAQSTKAGKHKIRPRAGEWGFLVRGKAPRARIDTKKWQCSTNVF